MRSTMPAVVLAVLLLSSCVADSPVEPPTAHTLRPATAEEVRDIAMNWHRHCFLGSVYGREKYLGRATMQRADFALRPGSFSVSGNILCTKIAGEPDRCRALFVGPTGPAIYITDARDFRGTDRWIPCRPLTKAP